MKTLVLTKGKTTIVDDDVYEWASKYKWSLRTNKYAGRAERFGPRKEGKTKAIYLHRQILNAASDDYVDHINGDTLDNRKCNLRICTNSENNYNKDKQKNNTSGFKGVWFCKRSKKWCAEIKADGKKHHLGRYKNKELAAEAYNEAAKILHKEFAKLNE